MALSESGLAAAGITPGPMVVTGPNGRKVTVRPKKGPAKGSKSVRGGRKQSLFVAPRGKGRRK